MDGTGGIVTPLYGSRMLARVKSSLPPGTPFIMVDNLEGHLDPEPASDVVGDLVCDVVGDVESADTNA